MVPATATSDLRKNACPLEPEPSSRSDLIERSRWHECRYCGATFGTAEGLRGHHRFGRCPVRGDPLDDVGLREDELRRRVRDRLRALAGGAV